jgi:cystathionine gamma-lyase
MRRDPDAAHGGPLQPGSLCVQLGLPNPIPAGPLTASPAFATAYHQDLDDVAPVVYGRWGHDSSERLELLLGSLDSGRAVVFNSGMAAISAVLLGLLRPGQVVVMFEGGTYYETRQIADHLIERGVTVRTVSNVAELQGAVVGARLVVLESPSNPTMRIYDIRAVAATASAAGALSAVDNSVSSPLGQCPLDLGADLVVSSDAKVVCGHNDLILGHVSTRDEDLLDALRQWRHLHGGMPSAFACWLAQRSIGTLEMRLRQQSSNAAALVGLLTGRPEVSDLRWPGSPVDPQYALASGQMTLPGGLVAFRLPSREHLHRFLRASRLVSATTSYGGLQTTANDIGAWPNLRVPAGFVRLSCGCEDEADLEADVWQALDAAKEERASCISC